jgi:redox-sensitive bicupin YhaK (pirin superfamily)
MHLCIMENRSIQVILAPPPTHMVGDGFKVHQYIPSAVPGGMHRMNPFLMMDYNSPHYFPPSDTPPGVGVHPHKGFETVTIAYQGKVAHHDSAGNSGVIGEGEVQWMTAASGVLHKEYHEASFHRQGGVFQMVQLWVNLPAKDKKSPPKYQSITRDQIQAVPLPDDSGQVKIIAGNFEGVSGPASTFTPVHLYNTELKAGGSVVFNFPSHYNTALVIISGNVKVNGQEAPANHFVLMNNDGESFSLQGTEDSMVLVLSGEPIQEPIAAFGPFVMNTRDELVEAYREFDSGKFGYLED